MDCGECENIPTESISSRRILSEEYEVPIAKRDDSSKSKILKIICDEEEHEGG